MILPRAGRHAFLASKTSPPSVEQHARVTVSYSSSVENSSLPEKALVSSTLRMFFTTPKSHNLRYFTSDRFLESTQAHARAPRSSGYEAAEVPLQPPEALSAQTTSHCGTEAPQRLSARENVDATRQTGNGDFELLPAAFDGIDSADDARFSWSFEDLCEENLLNGLSFEELCGINTSKFSGSSYSRSRPVRMTTPQLKYNVWRLTSS